MEAIVELDKSKGLFKMRVSKNISQDELLLWEECKRTGKLFQPVSINVGDFVSFKLHKSLRQDSLGYDKDRLWGLCLLLDKPETVTGSQRNYYGELKEQNITLESDPERPRNIIIDLDISSPQLGWEILVDHGSPEVNERTANRATMGDHPMNKSNIKAPLINPVTQKTGDYRLREIAGSGDLKRSPNDTMSQNQQENQPTNAEGGLLLSINPKEVANTDLSDPNSQTTQVQTSTKLPFGTTATSMAGLSTADVSHRPEGTVPESLNINVTEEFNKQRIQPSPTVIGDLNNDTHSIQTASTSFTQAGLFDYDHPAEECFFFKLFIKEGMSNEVIRFPGVAQYLQTEKQLFKGVNGMLKELQGQIDYKRKNIERMIRLYDKIVQDHRKVLEEMNAVNQQLDHLDIGEEGDAFMYHWRGSIDTILDSQKWIIKRMREALEDKIQETTPELLSEFKARYSAMPPLPAGNNDGGVKGWLEETYDTANRIVDEVLDESNVGGVGGRLEHTPNAVNKIVEEVTANPIQRIPKRLIQVNQVDMGLYLEPGRKVIVELENNNYFIYQNIEDTSYQGMSFIKKTDENTGPESEEDKFLKREVEKEKKRLEAQIKEKIQRELLEVQEKELRMENDRHKLEQEKEAFNTQVRFYEQQARIREPTNSHTTNYQASYSIKPKNPTQKVTQVPKSTSKTGIKGSTVQFDSNNLDQFQNFQSDVDLEGIRVTKFIQTKIVRMERLLGKLVTLKNELGEQKAEAEELLTPNTLSEKKYLESEGKVNKLINEIEEIEDEIKIEGLENDQRMITWISEFNQVSQECLRILKYSKRKLVMPLKEHLDSTQFKGMALPETIIKYHSNEKGYTGVFQYFKDVLDKVDRWGVEHNWLDKMINNLRAKNAQEINLVMSRSPIKTVEELIAAIIDEYLTPNLYEALAIAAHHKIGRIPDITVNTAKETLPKITAHTIILTNARIAVKEFWDKDQYYQDKHSGVITTSYTDFLLGLLPGGATRSAVKRMNDSKLKDGSKRLKEISQEKKFEIVCEEFDEQQKLCSSFNQSHSFNQANKHSHDRYLVTDHNEEKQQINDHKDNPIILAINEVKKEFKKEINQLHQKQDKGLKEMNQKLGKVEQSQNLGTIVKDKKEKDKLERQLKPKLPFELITDPVKANTFVLKIWNECQKRNKNLKTTEYDQPDTWLVCRQTTMERLPDAFSFDQKQAACLFMMNPFGCQICVGMMKKNNNSKLYPHLLKSYSKGYFDHFCQACPNFLFQDLEKRKEIIEKLKHFCKNCGSISEVPRCTLCERHIWRGHHNSYCNECQCVYSLGSCSTCKEAVEDRRKQYKTAFTDSCQEQDKHEEFHVRSLALVTVNSLIQLEYKANSLRNAKDRDIERDQGEDPDIFKDIIGYREVSLIIKSFQEAVDKNIVENREANESMMFHLSMKDSSSKGYISGIFDSGCTEFLITKEALERMFHKKIGKRMLEVAGSQFIETASAHILVPITGGKLNQEGRRICYKMARTLILPEIIKRVTEKNIAELMREAYYEYERICHIKNERPEFELGDFPTRVGGEVQYLVGPRVLNWETVFKFRGMVFISTNIDGGDKKQISVGGILPSDNLKDVLEQRDLANIVRLVQPEETLVRHQNWNPNNPFEREISKNHVEYDGLTVRNIPGEVDTVVGLMKGNQDLQFTPSFRSNWNDLVDFEQDNTEREGVSPTEILNDLLNTSRSQERNKDLSKLDNKNLCHKDLKEESQEYALEPSVNKETTETNKTINTSYSTNKVKSSVSPEPCWKDVQSTPIQVQNSQLDNFREDHNEWNAPKNEDLSKLPLAIDELVGQPTYTLKTNPDGMCLITSVCLFIEYTREAYKKSSDLNKYIVSLLSLDQYNNGFVSFPQTVIYGPNVTRIINNKKGLQEYYDSPEAVFTWRDHLEISSLANFMNINIEIFNINEEGNINKEVISATNPDQQTQEIKIVRRCEHYSPVITPGHFLYDNKEISSSENITYSQITQAHGHNQWTVIKPRSFLPTARTPPNTNIQPSNNGHGRSYKLEDFITPDRKQRKKNNRNNRNKTGINRISKDTLTKNIKGTDEIMGAENNKLAEDINGVDVLKLKNKMPKNCPQSSKEPADNNDSKVYFNNDHPNIISQIACPTFIQTNNMSDSNPINKIKVKPTNDTGMNYIVTLNLTENNKTLVEWIRNEYKTKNPLFSDCVDSGYEIDLWEIKFLEKTESMRLLEIIRNISDKLNKTQATLKATKITFVNRVNMVLNFRSKFLDNLRKGITNELGIQGKLIQISRSMKKNSCSINIYSQSTFKIPKADKSLISQRSVENTPADKLKDLAVKSLSQDTLYYVTITDDSCTEIKIQKKKIKNEISKDLKNLKENLTKENLVNHDDISDLLSNKALTNSNQEQRDCKNKESLFTAINQNENCPICQKVAYNIIHHIFIDHELIDKAEEFIKIKDYNYCPNIKCNSPENCWLSCSKNLFVAHVFLTCKDAGTRDNFLNTISTEEYCQLTINSNHNSNQPTTLIPSLASSSSSSSITTQVSTEECPSSSSYTISNSTSSAEASRSDYNIENILANNNISMETNQSNQLKTRKSTLLQSTPWEEQLIAAIREGEHSFDQGCSLHDSLKESNISLATINKAIKQGSQNHKEIRTQEDENKLTNNQLNNFQQIMESVLAPNTCPTYRCNTCKKCLECGPDYINDAQTRKERAKYEDNYFLKQSLRITKHPDDNSKLAIVCELPVNEEVTRNTMSSSNYREASQEYDAKMRNLSIDDKKGMQEEFDKLIQKKVFISIESLPVKDQKEIWNAKPINFISVAPAFKANSESTPCRAAMNCSRQRSRSKISLNDTTITGLTRSDMSKAARVFKILPYAVAGDIKKYYNNIHLSKKCWAMQLLCWRKDGLPTNPLKVYVMTRLMYGVRSAATLSFLALMKIVKYGESLCPLCKGSFTIDPENTDIIINPPNMECKGIAHKFALLARYFYVDDCLFSAPTEKEIQELTSFCDKLFLTFDYQIKHWNFANEEFDPSNPTLNQDGNMPLAGYIYTPSKDTIKLKTPLHTTGIKWRGKWIPQKARKIVEKGKKILVPAEPFIIKAIRETGECEPEFIRNIYKNSRKTLQLVTSRAGMFTYDSLGLVQPLVSQLRKTTSQCAVYCKGNFESEVSQELWEHYLLQLSELAKAALFEYPRIPKTAVVDGACIDLICTCDSSTTATYVFHLIYPTRNKEKVSAFLFSRSHLLSPTTSVPRGEHTSLSIGSHMFLIIIKELAQYLKSAIICCDSLCSIFWTLSNPKDLTKYISTRTKNIVSNLNNAARILSSNKATSPTEFTKILHWIPGNCNRPADLGTKYKIAGIAGKTKMITAQDVSPESIYHKGEPWFKNQEEAKRTNKLKSAQDILEQNCVPRGEVLENFETAVKKNVYSTITGESTEILTEDHEIKRYTHMNDDFDSAMLAFQDIATHNQQSNCVKCAQDASNDIYYQCIFCTKCHQLRSRRFSRTNNKHSEIRETALLVNNSNDVKMEEPFQTDDHRAITLIGLKGIADKSEKERNEIIAENLKRYYNTGCYIKQPQLVLSWCIPITTLINPNIKKTFRILLLVVTATRKFLGLIKKEMKLTTVHNPNVTSLTIEGDIYKIKPNPEQIKYPQMCKLPLLVKDSKKKQVDLEPLVISDVVMLHKTNNVNNFTTRTPNFVKHHPQAKQIVRMMSQLFNIVTNMTKKIRYEEARQAFILGNQILNKISFKKVSISNLSSFASHDLYTIMNHLYNKDPQLLDKVITDQVKDWENEIRNKGKESEITEGERSLSNYIHPKFYSDDSSINFRTKEVNINHCYKTKEELMLDNDVMSHYCSMITTSELIENVPAYKYKSNTVIIQNVAYSQTRFGQLFEAEENHGKAYIEVLHNHGLHTHIITLANMSPLSYGIARFYHINEISWKRPSNRFKHSGSTRAILLLSKSKRILNSEDLLRLVVINCGICRLRLRKYIPTIPGKIRSFHLLPPSSHHTVVYIDLLTNLKLYPLPNQKTTRGMTVVDYHLLVMVCAISRYVTIGILANRKTASLALTLKAMIDRTAVTPTLFLADREGAFVRLALKSNWQVEQNHISNDENISIQFCPSDEKGHQNHSVAERKIQALRHAMGESDLESLGPDVTTLVNNVHILEAKLNQIPIASRTIKDKAKFKGLGFELITPSMLIGRSQTRNRMSVSHLKIEGDHFINMKRIEDNIALMDEVSLLYLQHLNSQTIELDENNPQAKPCVGSIVAIPLQKGKFEKHCSKIRFGKIISLSNTSVDGKPRSAIVSIKGQPGDDLENGTLHIGGQQAIHRRLDQLILITEPGSTLEETLETNAKTSKIIPEDTPRNDDFQQQKQDYITQIDTSRDNLEAAQKEQTTYDELEAIQKETTSESNSSSEDEMIRQQNKDNTQPQKESSRSKTYNELEAIQEETTSESNSSSEGEIIIQQNKDTTQPEEESRRSKRKVTMKRCTCCPSILNNSTWITLIVLFSLVVPSNLLHTEKVPPDKSTFSVLITTLTLLNYAKANTNNIFSDPSNKLAEEMAKNYLMHQGKEVIHQGKVAMASIREHMNMQENPFNNLNDNNGNMDNKDETTAETKLLPDQSSTVTLPQGMSSITAIINQETIVNCNAGNNFLHGSKVKWKVPSPAQTAGELTINGRILKISKTKQDHTGQYECSVTLKGTSTQDKQVFNIKVFNNTGIETNVKIDNESIDHPFESYDCSNYDKILKINLFDKTSSCNKNDFKTYNTTSQKVPVTILQEKILTELKAKTCKITVKESNAHCRQNTIVPIRYQDHLYLETLGLPDKIVVSPGVDGFIQTYQGNYPVDPESCLLAHKTGRLSVKFGDQQVVIQNLADNAIFGKTYFLHGSNVDESGYCNGTDHFMYKSILNKTKISVTGKVVMLQLTVELASIIAIHDMIDHIVAIPSWGLNMKMIQEQKNYTEITSKGTVIVETMNDDSCTSKHKEVITTNGTLFKDTTPSKNNKTHPDIIIIEHQQKEIALQIFKGSHLHVCNTKCYKTQLKNILICMGFPAKEKIVKDNSIVDQISSQSLLFLQMNTDSITSEILTRICKLQRKITMLTFNNFQLLGASLIDTYQGNLLMQTAEEGVVIQCQRKVAWAIKTEGRCCKNLPINTTTNTNKNIYLQPINRIISNDCLEIECNEDFPQSFAMTTEKNVCQYVTGPKICDRGLTLELDKPTKLITLSQSQSNSGSTDLTLMDNIKRLVYQSMGRALFSTNLMSILTTNDDNCGDQPECDQVTWFPEAIRKELGRQILSNIWFFMMHNPIGQVLNILAVSWSIITIFRGVLNFLFRIRAFWRKGHLTSKSYLGMLISILLEFDASLNPLTTTRAELRQKISSLDLRLGRAEDLIHQLVQTIEVMRGQEENEETNNLMPMNYS